MALQIAEWKGPTSPIWRGNDNGYALSADISPAVPAHFELDGIC